MNLFRRRLSSKENLSPLTVAVGIVCVVVLLSPDVPARVVRSFTPSRTVNNRMITIGSGFEYQSNSDETNYDFPFLLEYTISKRLTISAECSYQILSAINSPGLRGIGDLETRLKYDFVTERRNRPRYAIVAAASWPTASPEELGAEGMGVGFGLDISKEFISSDISAEAIYHFTSSDGELRTPDQLELALAGELHLSRWFDLISELRTTRYFGNSYLIDTSGSTGSSEHLSPEYGFTLGFAQQIRENIRLEQGFALQGEGIWQLLVSWEWEIGGE